MVVAYTYNPSARESQAFNPRTKAKYNTGGDRGLTLNFQLPSLGRGMTSLVVWLFHFSDHQLEFQYLTLDFYYLCYMKVNWEVPKRLKSQDFKRMPGLTGIPSHKREPMPDTKAGGLKDTG